MPIMLSNRAGPISLHLAISSQNNSYPCTNRIVLQLSKVYLSLQHPQAARSMFTPSSVQKVAPQVPFKTFLSKLLLPWAKGCGCLPFLSILMVLDTSVKSLLRKRKTACATSHNSNLPDLATTLRVFLHPFQFNDNLSLTK